MAQRILTCPNCSAQIAVPDNYFRANIQCATCGAVVDRRTGALPDANPAQAAASGPVPQQYAPQPAPFQQYAPRPMQAPQYASSQPMPAQYRAGGQGYPGGPPAYPAQYAPYQQPRKSNTGLIIGLVGGGIALLVVLVIVGAAVGFAAGNIDETGPWHPYRSEAGGFEIEFPEKPTVTSETMDTPMLDTPSMDSRPGKRTLYRAYYMPFGMNFEASYFDLGSGPVSDYIYDYQEAAREVAKEVGGRVQPAQEKKFGMYTGSLVKITNKADRLSTVLFLRVGNRVYLVAVENHATDQQTMADRFINSFKLLNQPASTDPYLPYRSAGNSWAYKSTTSAGGRVVMTMNTRHEVLSVTDEGATVRMISFDSDMKEISRYDSPMSFVVTDAPGSSGYAVPAFTREKIRVPAGEFDCDRSESGDSVTWICRKTRLMVKMESPSFRMELTEFNVK